MRVLGKILFYFTLAVIIFWLGKTYLLQPKNVGTIPYEMPADIITESSKAYLLDVDDYLEFGFSQAPEKIWLATTARLRIDNSGPEQATYRLLFEFIDSNDSVVFEHEHYYLTEAEEILDLDGDKVPIRFFENITFASAKLRSIYISASQFMAAESVRISLLDKSNSVADVGISVYQRAKRDANLEPLLIWQRFSDQDKTKISRRLALPAEFNDTEEKIALAEYRWDPIAPLGIPGINYQQLVLYRISREEGFWPDSSWFKNIDNLADNYKAVTFPVHQDSNIKLTFSHDFNPDKTYQVTIKWYPPFAALPEVNYHSFEQPNITLEQPVKRGLLEITSTIPLDVSAVSTDAAVLLDQRHYSSSYQVNSAQDIEFPIQSYGQQLTPVRVDVRKYAAFEQGATGKIVNVQYQWLDEADNIIKQGRLLTTDEPDLYQQLASKEPYDQVSRRLSGYFLLPATVRKIRLISDRPILVSLAVSPLNLQYLKKLPSQQRNWFDDEKSFKRWYDIKPLHWQLLESAGRKFALRVFHRPVFIAEEILKGEFQSKVVPVVSPNPVWRELMLPFSMTGRITEPNPQYIYSLVHSNGLFLPTQQQQAGPTATLFYLRGSGQPSQVNLSVNGQSAQPLWLTAKWGRLKLNGLTAESSNRLEFSDNDARWFINQQLPGKDAYQIRNAVQITQNQTVRFRVNKNSDKISLLLRFYSYDNVDTVVSARISVPGKAGVYAQYTQANHRWQLSDDKVDSGYVLQSKLRVGGEQKMSFGLFSDLANGVYDIDVKLEKGKGGFVAMTQISNEPDIKIRMFKQGNESHD